MNVEEVKNALMKRAVVFETGGKQPTKEFSESWIGRVGFCLEGEGVPVDNDGNQMYPLAMLFLNELPFTPDSLQGIDMLAIYFSKNIYNHLLREDFDGYYLIREYKRGDRLNPCNFVSDCIKPFPLIPSAVENDYPVWDGGGIPSELEEEILRLEDEEGIDYLDDIVEELYSMHKIGGWPTFCQPGVWFGDEYEFVLQISSDPKANLNIVDRGSFYFYRNVNTGAWKLHCDFY